MKPRTQAELDAFYAEHTGLEESLKLAAYVDAGVQAWKRRYDPAHISGRYDNYDANDAKHEAMFPRAEYTVTVRGKPK
jgi:hypothetical protein